MPASGKFVASARTLGHQVANGFLALTHNGFALLGLVVVVCAGTALARPDLRQSAEVELMGWLQERHIATTEAAWQPSEPGAIERATATNPAELLKQQAAVAFWLSKKYRVAPEPLGALVAEAYEVGRQTKLDPTLILAITLS